MAKHFVRNGTLSPEWEIIGVLGHPISETRERVVTYLRVVLSRDFADFIDKEIDVLRSGGRLSNLARSMVPPVPDNIITVNDLCLVLTRLIKGGEIGTLYGIPLAVDDAHGSFRLRGLQYAIYLSESE